MGTAELTRRTPSSPARGLSASTGLHERERASVDVVQACFLWLTTLAVLLPLGRVVTKGDWSLAAVLLCAILLAVGQLARLARLGGLGALVAEVVVAAALFTAVGFPGTGLLGVVPTGATVEAASEAVTTGLTQISNGVAPLAATPEVVVTVLLPYAVLVILLDWVVLWARLPLLGGVLILLLVVLPGAVVPADEDVWAVLLALLGVGMMLYRATAAARREAGTDSPGAMPLVVGAVATVLAVGAATFVAPVLPGGPGTVTSGIGPGPRIDASIDLGRDLRRPREAQLLTYRTTLSSPPYLRMATLTRFSGDVWRPDRGETVPLSWLGGNPDTPDDGRIATAHQTATIETASMRSDLLPVPARATGVDGVEGSWRVLPDGRTLRSPEDSAGGQNYTVGFDTVSPTAEQMRQFSASAAGTTPDALAVPSDVPPELVQLAQQVTAGAESDYDRLLALQNWFRSSEFTYSLDAPVEDGFDGTSMRALGQFLQVRSGYCVHFATAFTLMARSLGMPTRVVLGTLPGETTGQTVDDQVVWQTTSSDLHTWPEVHFSGVGWVPFEPTASLGTPTSYASEATAAPSAEPTASAPAPTATARDDTENIPTAAPTASADGGATVQRLAPALAFAVIAAGVLLVPFLVRWFQRRRRRSAAARGDAVAAWDEFRADLMDHGVSVPEGDTPRAVAADALDRLPSELSAPLVTAIERHSYAERDDGIDGAVLAAALDRVHRELRRGLRPDARVVATLFPRSLAHPIRRRLPSRARRTASG